jgi:hypothetical protein
MLTRRLTLKLRLRLAVPDHRRAQVDHNRLSRLPAAICAYLADRLA